MDTTNSMGNHFHPLLMLIGCLTTINHFIEAQNQEGFISLDCGLSSKDQTYIETITNITYTSDEGYVGTGIGQKIEEKYQEMFQRQILSLRSFPEGTRNCYTMNLIRGNKYLIRVAFLYGNYDGLNILPSFEIFIGPNNWKTIEIKGITNTTILELIHVVNSDRLQICLVKIGLTVPFISSIELRPLNKDAYVTQHGSLTTISRVFLDPDKDPPFLRYPHDIHDRIWIPYFQTEWSHLNTTQLIASDGAFDPPQLALQSAGVPTNESKPLNLTWTIPGNVSTYVYMHFVEIELLNKSEARVFDITYNGGKMWYSHYQPRNFTLGTLYNPKAIRSDDGHYNFVFRKDQNSALPPLLNAIEIYMVVDLQKHGTYSIDVDSIENIMMYYEVAKASWQGDPCLPKLYSWNDLNCSYHSFDNTRITYLNLSSRELTGNIAPSIQNLTKLRVLNLSNNKLKGEIPDFLAEMTTLEIIDLRNNKLNGSLSKALAQKKDEGVLMIAGNQFESPKAGKEDAVVIPLIASTASLVALAVIVTILYVFFRRGKNPFKTSTTNKNSDAPPTAPVYDANPSLCLDALKDPRFTYSDVLKMTNNFQQFLGEGGFGKVYHGYINGKEEVAVKLFTESSAKGYKQFKSEVDILLRVHHRNLVSLVGYCDDGEHFALIYEYMAQGDLKRHLSDKCNENQVLSWEARLRIALDAAQGLEYLHNGCKPPMLHRDIKPTNILLNNHFQAKLADFGLSRSFTIDDPHRLSTLASGTPGYVDPRYFGTSMLSEKSDIYSFGVVLLEIMTNQPVIDHVRQGTHITEWVNMKLESGDMMQIIDPQLQSNVNLNIAWKMIELAMNCVSLSVNRRPTMTHVVIELNDCLEVERVRRTQSKKIEHSQDSLNIGVSFVNKSIPRP